MFTNEAFQFFWLISIAQGFSVFAALAGSIGLIVTIVLLITSVGPYPSDEDKFQRKLGLRWMPVAIFALILACITPPPSAFYAGAGQHIAETEELDDTLRNLKVVLDKKIEELAEKELAGAE